MVCLPKEMSRKDRANEFAKVLMKEVRESRVSKENLPAMLELLGNVRSFMKNGDGDIVHKDFQIPNSFTVEVYRGEGGACRVLIPGMDRDLGMFEPDDVDPFIDGLVENYEGRAALSDTEMALRMFDSYIEMYGTNHGVCLFRFHDHDPIEIEKRDFGLIREAIMDQEDGGCES